MVVCWLRIKASQSMLSIEVLGYFNGGNTPPPQIWIICLYDGFLVITGSMLKFVTKGDTEPAPSTSPEPSRTLTSITCDTHYYYHYHYYYCYWSLRLDSKPDVSGSRLFFCCCCFFLCVCVCGGGLFTFTKMLHNTIKERQKPQNALYDLFKFRLSCSS